MLRQARFVPALIIMIVLVLSSCSNFPSADRVTELSHEDVAKTAVAEVFAQQTAAAVLAAAAAVPAVQEVAPPPVQAAATASPTPCAQHVTANTNANVRLGDTVEHNIIGNLPTGASAPVAGQNADHTWWYIEFPGVVGGHGWIAGSVVSAFCISADLAVVAAPEIPTEAVVAKPTKKPRAGVTLEAVHPDWELSDDLVQQLEHPQYELHINPDLLGP